MDEEIIPRRKRRSRAQIDELIAAFEASGQTQRRFCAERGLHVATFSAWLRKRRAGAAPEGFRPIRLVPGAGLGANVTVRLPDGIEIEFPLQAKNAEVAALITSLRGSLA